MFDIEALALIENDIDFVLASEFDECCASGCEEKAYGTLYYGCYDPECCGGPMAFFCKKHLVEEFGVPNG